MCLAFQEWVILDVFLLGLQMNFYHQFKSTYTKYLIISALSSLSSGYREVIEFQEFPPYREREREQETVYDLLYWFTISLPGTVRTAM